ncbi:hypothetical protein DGMP_04290 [Desulfomarina profundi]|uniref:PASTA domain-containing protein n=2 Tax=Desulfomarina profundi TaxID=2772557 RepID=A0A8D5JQ76_9BACT|nr:hypothetical protein DGMP_04290 [Desulfomarina profundi]
MSQQPIMKKCLTDKVLKIATCFLLMGAIFFAVNAFSQSAQLVKGGTVGNRVYLEIVNDSHEPVLDVSIRRKKIPSFVTNVNIRPEHIARIGAGKKIRAEVTFDIKRKTGKHSPQPLEFTLHSKNGQFSNTTPELLLQLEKQKKHVLPVDPKKTARTKTGKYVYVLTEVEVHDKPYSSVKKTRQIEHIPGQLGYTIKDFTPAYKKVTQLRCIDCPTEITVGKSIHFKFDLRTRYDSEKYQCEENKSYDRWPPGLRFISSTGDLEAIAKGKPLHMPSCQELGLKGHETQNDPNSRVITAEDNVYDPVGLTLDERVSLTTDIRFTGDATDRDSVFYNDPAFSYTAEYTSDGKLFKEFRETKFTVEYDNRLLKTPDHLKENRIQFSINGMSLTYTLQINGVPKSIAVIESTRASAFDEPALNTIQVADTTGKINGRGTARDTEVRHTSEKKLPTKRSELEGKRQKKPIVSTAVDPHQPDTAVLIKKWLQRAKPLENADGARLRFDKWGRKYGTAANGGIITLNNSPDNPVSSMPEVHVWAHRHSLDSINLCKLEEYVLAQLNGTGLDHCKKSPKKKITSIPDVTGMSKKQAETKLNGLGLKTKVSLGTPASSEKESLKVEKTTPGVGATVKRGATITIVLHTPFVNTKKVPEFKGYRAKDVIKRIRKIGLIPKINMVKAASSNQTGRIRSLDPPSGTRLKANATVLVNVFGPYVRTLRVPDVKGYTGKQARDQLASIGLKLDIVKNKPTKDRSLAGTVESQIPEAGSTVKAGKVIEIVVYEQSLPDCSDLPGSSPLWDQRKQKYYCGCTGNYERNNAGNGCRLKKEIQVAEKNCLTGTHAEWSENREKALCYCDDGTWDSSLRRCVTERDRALTALNCSYCEKPYYDESRKNARCVCASGCGYDSTIAPYCMPKDKLAHLRRQRRQEVAKKERRREEERRRRKKQEEANRQRECQQYLNQLNNSVVKGMKQWQQLVFLTSATITGCNKNEILAAQKGQWRSRTGSGTGTGTGSQIVLTLPNGRTIVYNGDIEVDRNMPTPPDQCPGGILGSAPGPCLTDAEYQKAWRDYQRRLREYNSQR